MRQLVFAVLLLFGVSQALALGITMEEAVVVEDVTVKDKTGNMVPLKSGDTVVVQFCFSDGSRCILEQPSAIIESKFLTHAATGKPVAEYELEMRAKAAEEEAAKRAAALPRPNHIVGWGDSMTAGIEEVEGRNYLGYVGEILNRKIYNEGVGGENSTEVRDRMVQGGDLNKGIVVIWAGRNNIGSPARALSNIADMVAATDGERYLVVSIINGEDEPRGSLPYRQIEEINAELKRLYGDHFVDVRAALVDAAKFEEREFRDADVTPDSVRADKMHLNNKGYEIVGRQIATKILLNRW